MRCERLTPSGDPAATAAELRGLVPTAASVRDAVTAIIETVRRGGDRAVLEYTRRFDSGESEPKPIHVEEAELDDALARLEPKVKEALSQSVENVTRVSRLLAPRAGQVDFETHSVRLRELPVGRAAVYVPGGRAPYPSSVVMGVVPARVAGVEEVVVCSPPGSQGEVDPVVLGACRLAGASGVYRMGGAQAIAALAYGTESVDPVDVVVGPGNLYVQEAKRQVNGQVRVDGFAGPSDLAVIADGDADPRLVALDLLAQAEHGPGTLVAALSDSEALLSELVDQLEPAEDTGSVAALVHAADPEAALRIAEAFAPEHLQLVGAAAEALVERVTRAGCVFVGPRAGTAFGDYVAGSNHILPTDGTPRWASGVSPLHFRRTVNEVRISDPEQLAKWGAALARAEGFELHARSMEARIRQNRPDGE